MDSDDEAHYLEFELPFSDLESFPSQHSSTYDQETPDSRVQLRSPASFTTPNSERTSPTGSSLGTFDSGDRRMMAEDLEPRQLTAEDFEDIDFVDVNETFPTPEEIIPTLEMISNSLDDDDGRLPLVNRLIRNYRQNRLTRADLDALRMFAPIIFRIRENEWWANGIAINKRSRRN